MKKRKRSRKPRKTRTPHSRRVTGVEPNLVEAGKETRFKPGVSGNPAGRPRTKIFREIAREIVGMVDTKTKKERARKLIDALVKQAENGSLGHFRQVLNLLEEDSATPQTRVALTAEASAPATKLSLQETLARIRQIYGLSDPDHPGMGDSSVFARRLEQARAAPPETSGA
jgi:ribosomal protein L17